jgi:dynein intermediate chain
MKMIGTQNANNLISSSTDGLVCSWLADMLSQPQVSCSCCASRTPLTRLTTQSTLPLTVPSHNKTDEVSITCLDFPDSETATFWIGTEEGSVYQASRYDRASAKAGLSTEYRGHAGPVTGLDFHPGTGSIDFSDLFLTSSVDWTVKLWSKKSASALHTFEDQDYVFDVQWHPNHPGLFGSVDGLGKFDLWNLNGDVEVSAGWRMRRN